MSCKLARSLIICKYTAERLRLAEGWTDMDDAEDSDAKEAVEAYFFVSSS